MSGLQPASMHDGMERYAHCQGEVMFRRRAPMQVAATLGQKRAKQMSLRRLAYKSQVARHLRARLFGLSVCCVLPLGFVLGRRDGAFLKGLKPKELEAIREILVWGRQPGNNKVLEAWS